MTLAYDGIEMLIENFRFKQLYKLTWAPQAMIFALVSTVAFIYFDLAIGFIFEFVATITSSTTGIIKQNYRLNFLNDIFIINRADILFINIYRIHQ